MATDTESAVPTYQQVVAAWNAQADEHNQWDALGEDEKIEWAMACANAAPPAVVEPLELSPDFTDTARAALLWVLWHHQGESSPVGQPIRFALGMGQHDRLNEHQLAEAKRWERLHPVNPAVFQRGTVPLTDEQIQEAILPINPHGMGYFLRIARAIEHAHGIGIKKGDSHGLPT